LSRFRKQPRFFLLNKTIQLSAFFALTWTSL